MVTVMAVPSVTEAWERSIATEGGVWAWARLRKVGGGGVKETAKAASRATPIDTAKKVRVRGILVTGVILLIGAELQDFCCRHGRRMARRLSSNPQPQRVGRRRH